MLVCVASAVQSIAGQWTSASTPPNGVSFAETIICTRIPAEKSDLGSPLFLADRRRPLPDGSAVVRHDVRIGGAELRPLTSDFVSAGRADVSFDGRRILFVGKRTANERFRAWEMNADGSNVRLVSDCATDCLAAVYLSTIYTLDADVPVHQVALVSRPSDDVPPALYTSRLDGSRLRRITFHPGGAFDPVPLSDGRLLFVAGIDPAAATPTPRAPRTALMTVFPDGTELFPFAALHAPPALRFAPCTISGDRVAFLESPAFTDGGSTRMLVVSRIRSLLEPKELLRADGCLIASLRPADVGRMLASVVSSSNGTLDLYLSDENRAGDWTTLLESADAHELDPMLLASRTEPAGRSSVVRDDVSDGELFVLDAYLSDGSVAPLVERGRIHAIRVLAAEDADPSATNGGDMSGPIRRDERARTSRIVALGIVPVEPDGSFYARVPAQTPLRLETLDGSGHSITTMSSWFWVMPGERRGCIGCHEDRERTPPNRHPLALRRSPRALPMLGSDRESANKAVPPKEDSGP